MDYRKSLAALAIGTFGIGMSEYVMMAILPFMAADFGVSIVQAGYLISSYAIGVCVGAPVVAIFARTWPLRKILKALMIVYTASVLGMALTDNYLLMLVMRFIGGLPHGAFFSVGAIVADRLAPRGKSTFAVAVMCSGMTVSNLLGIPVATLVAGLWSWKWIFVANVAVGLLSLYGVSRWIPWLEALPNHGLKNEFRFLLTLAPWLLFGCTMFGNGGIFCWYSYISPTMTELSGVPESWMTLVIALAGLGMFLGNLSGGKLSDRFGPGHTGLGIELVIFGSLLLIGLTAHWAWCSIPLMFVATAGLFAVSSPQQLLFIRHSKGGEILGGAMVQIAFNLGNAIGAWFGGLPIDEAQPTTYHYPALLGALLAVGGVVCYYVFCRRYERRTA